MANNALPISYITVKGVKYAIQDERVADILQQIANFTSINDGEVSNNTTYSSSKIRELLQNVSKFKVLVVNSLPTEDIDEEAIYLVSKTTDALSLNVKDEYIYVNGQWEKIGDTSITIDLSDYYTKQQTYSKQQVDVMLAALPDNDTQYQGDGNTIEIINNTIKVKQGVFDYTSGSNNVTIDPVNRTISVTESGAVTSTEYSAAANSPIIVNNNTHEIGFDSSKLNIPEQIEYEAETNSPIIVNNTTRKIDIDPTKLPQPAQYSGEGGIIVNNNTHVISLEDGVISQPVEVEPEVPNNYYTYNGIKVIVPQGKGIIRLNHDYVLPTGANPSFYDAGVYIEDTEETVNCPQTARKLDYLIVVPDGGDESYINTEEAADWWDGRRVWKIPFNSQGCIYDPSNENSSWSYSVEHTLECYGDVLRDGDLCFDNYGNVCYISNLGSFYSFYDIDPKKVRFIINKSKSVPVSSAGASYSSIQFGYGSLQNAEIIANGYLDNQLPNPTRRNKNLDYIHLNYTQYYPFRTAYKSPHTGKVFYVYGTPDESVALACYLREMDDGNIRPAFAGFLLFGTPNSLEPPIERNNSATEITSYQWTEPRPQIRFVEAASINNAVANIGTSSLQTDDIIVVKNPGATLTFPSGNSTVTLYDIPFEPMFRWDGSEFKPMFYYIK